VRSQSLLNEYAMRIAQACVQVVRPALRVEEQHDAFAAFFDAVKPLLDEYETRAERMIRRVRPGAD
jgi:hypothetical protein